MEEEEVPLSPRQPSIKCSKDCLQCERNNQAEELAWLAQVKAEEIGDERSAIQTHMYRITLPIAMATTAPHITKH